MLNLHAVGLALKHVQLLALAALVLVGGCTNYRLQQNFNSEPLGSAPAQFPAPDPPADDLTWAKQTVQPVVVARATGGRWVQIKPGQGFQDTSRSSLALLAWTDYFKTAWSGVRGHFTLRLDGFGKVLIGLRSLQTDAAEGSWLGGYLISNYALPGNPGGVAWVGNFELHNLLTLHKNEEIVGAGTAIAPYTPGQTIDLFWSIRQDIRDPGKDADANSQTLYLGVLPPGETVGLEFDRARRDEQPEPLKRLWITVMLYDWSQVPPPALFLDDVTVEEFR